MQRRNLIPSPARMMPALVAVVCLLGCASSPSTAPTPPPLPAPVSPVSPAAPSASPPVPSAPASLPATEVASTLRSAQGLLQEGDADAALELLQRVLAVDPGNALAASYLRQIEGDPVALLGRESYAYTVKPGESVSSIARDKLRDANLFFVLARYNNIRVPRLLGAGQTIRIPGRAPAVVPAPAAPASTGPTPATPTPPGPAPEPTPTPTSPSAEEKATRINAMMRQAREAFSRQDLCGSIRVYDSVLELDPNHLKARSERQRSVQLIERLRKQGGKLGC